MTTQNVPAIIEKAKAVMPTDKQFLSANPYEMSFKQEYGFAIMAIQNNPFLLKCTPDSIKSAVISVALTGISLNPALKYAYLPGLRQPDTEIQMPKGQTRGASVNDQSAKSLGANNYAPEADSCR